MRACFVDGFRSTCAGIVAACNAGDPERPVVEIRRSRRPTARLESIATGNDAPAPSVEKPLPVTARTRYRFAIAIGHR
jgi:hypothetical protein